MAMRTHLLLLAALPPVGCRVVGGPDWRAIDTVRDEAVTLEVMADALAGADVVFLGEEHDNGVGHELQLRLTGLLADRREVVVSLEMFERDAQDLLDLYLAGAIDESLLLAHGRPWGNYHGHYRPVVELARERGLRVLAANCYRPLASRAARDGRWSIAGDPWAAAAVDAGEGRYKDKFVAAMGDHAAEMGASLDDFFTAQCVKDDTMAESIARVLAGPRPARPLVVHWCGRFHSDGGLGTVERLVRRVPDARVGIVTMLAGRVGRDLTADERRLADYVWLVPKAD